MKHIGSLIYIGLCCHMIISAEGETSQPDAVLRRKIKECRTLTNRAIEFIKNNPIDTACHEFARNTNWRLGETQIFVFDEGGVCYVFGDDFRYIWSDFQTKKTIAQEDFIAQMIAQGKAGGGLINFTWNNGYMQAYVKTVTKDGALYIVGAGFYPDSGKYLVQQLVTSAIDYAALRPLQSVITRINNQLGMFVQGDLYLTMYDFKGTCIAHGKSPELIGQNLIDTESSDGKYPIRDMLAIAQSEEGHGWYEYAAPEGGVMKRSYIQKFEKDGKKYFIAGGYYPTVSEADVRGLVKRAISYMRTHGAELAFGEFSQPHGKFAYGGVTLFAYDMKGTIVADMANPAFRGQNLSNTVDADGRYVTRIIIQQAQQYGSGWVSFNLKNAYTMMFIERVKLPDGTFIVGASYYPVGKPVSVRFMVEKAARFLEQKPKEDAFFSFVSGNSEFLRGDVFVEVYDEDGTSYVYGHYMNRIFDNHLRHTDDKGVPIIKKIVALAKSGGGWIEFEHFNRTRRAYVKYVTKPRVASKHVKQEATIDIQYPPENFIVLSGYYK